MLISISAIYPYFVQARADIANAREEWAKEALAYAKQGFRPARCIHGVNMWVDYDCACYMCEADLSDLEWARSIAYKRYHYANNLSLV